MLSYCLKEIECKRNTESKNLKVARIKNGKTMLLLPCDSKKSKFIKKQEASGLLSSLGIKKPLSKIPLLSPLLF